MDAAAPACAAGIAGDGLAGTASLVSVPGLAGSAGLLAWSGGAGEQAGGVRAGGWA